MKKVNMPGQMSFFDGAKPFKLTKPIRLLELFAGYSSITLALKYLGVKFEYWHIAEWAVKSIQANYDLHHAEDKTDYSAGLTKEKIFSELCRMGISADYSTPMTYEQIKRMGENKARKVYNNVKATRNLVSVCNIKGEDLEIVDTDKYQYILSWSYPCQALSNAGKREGMKEGSGTTSSLGWEVIRLLKECKELPQCLLMENVPQVLGSQNISEFSRMVKELDALGYTSKWQILNATDFNVPQNRERCFMVSILGDYYYDFPQPVGCKRVLKDVLEPKVDESYYLKPEVVVSLIKHKERHDAEGHGFGWKPIDIDGGGYARTIKTEGGYRPQTNFIIERPDIGGILISNQATKIEKATNGGNGSDGNGGEVVKANGIDIGKSIAFFHGEYNSLSRTLRTDDTSGVVEWKD